MIRTYRRLREERKLIVMRPIDWDREYENPSIPFWETEKPEDMLVSFIEKEIPECALDAGCGAGTDLIYLGQRADKVIGIDLSFPGLLRARRRIEGGRLPLSLVQGNVLALPFSACFFDFVNDRGCFHHISPGKRDNYVSEIHRVLKPSGHMLLRCFGERYFEKGGTGYPLSREILQNAFSSRFHINNITDYESFVEGIPVDMSWCLLRKKQEQAPRCVSPL